MTTSGTVASHLSRPRSAISATTCPVSQSDGTIKPQPTASRSSANSSGPCLIAVLLGRTGRAVLGLAGRRIRLLAAVATSPARALVVLDQIPGLGFAPRRRCQHGLRP